MKFTKATVERLELPADKKDRVFFDDALPGFGLRLREGGSKRWIIQYRVGTQQRRMVLGTIQTLDVEEARKRAREALSKVHLGSDPQLAKVEARAEASVTLAPVAEDYLERYAATRLKARSLIEVRRHLRTHWKPLGKLPVRKITRANVAARLAAIAKENGPVAANRARAALSSLYAWAIAEGIADANPVIGTNKAIEEVARDRVLTDDELRHVWRQAEEAPTYGAIVRLLVLTGQRREEVGGMLWSELDLAQGVWRIGAARSKNGLAHSVPLSPPALTILKARSKREGRDFVFGTGEGAFSGWSNGKEALDMRIRAELTKADANAKLHLWRLHDVRRTVATRMAELGVFPHIVEAVLNHMSGHKAGVAGVYNHATYAAEKKAALHLWASHVVTLNESAD